MIVKIPTPTSVRKMSIRLPDDIWARYDAVEASAFTAKRKLRLAAVLSRYLRIRVSSYERAVAAMLKREKAKHMSPQNKDAERSADVDSD